MRLRVRLDLASHVNAFTSDISPIQVVPSANSAWTSTIPPRPQLPRNMLDMAENNNTVSHAQHFHEVGKFKKNDRSPAKVTRVLNNRFF